MFRVKVYSGGVIVEELEFKQEIAAEAYASMMQDRGYKVRIV